MARKVKDLVGKEFGDLVVVAFYGRLKPKNKKDKKVAWVCRCKCGLEVVIRASCLCCKNHQSSCFDCARKNNGLKYSNLTGNRYGRLVVVSKASKPKNVKNGSQYWNVVCDCGVEKVVSTNPLKNGTTISCGCYNKEVNRKIHITHGLSSNWSEYHKFRRKDPSVKLKDYVGNQVREIFKLNNQKKHGSVWLYLPYTPIELKEHLETLWEPWMNWDNYGGSSDNPEKTWWVDHIKPQSSFKYKTMNSKKFLECWSLKNLRPLEKKENMRKWKN